MIDTIAWNDKLSFYNIKLWNLAVTWPGFFKKFVHLYRQTFFLSQFDSSDVKILMLKYFFFFLVDNDVYLHPISYLSTRLLKGLGIRLGEFLAKLSHFPKGSSHKKSLSFSTYISVVGFPDCMKQKETEFLWFTVTVMLQFTQVSR